MTMIQTLIPTEWKQLASCCPQELAAYDQKEQRFTRLEKIFVESAQLNCPSVPFIASDQREQREAEPYPATVRMFFPSSSISFPSTFHPQRRRAEEKRGATACLSRHKPRWD
ncbi:hypothetical protein Mapa_011349 [Marchantia paleacea]|nr:hypothetical protein Mapa_011349 [Marchantia paleacea]